MECITCNTPTSRDELAEGVCAACWYRETTRLRDEVAALKAERDAMNDLLHDALTRARAQSLAGNHKMLRLLDGGIGKIEAEFGCNYEPGRATAEGDAC